ncbi:hypothetical protein RB195_009617 [Necator americanus]|uniref:Transthyretin-like family protein n=1 Tax=Necator americanus TaxID=51031 RepID=A0ABR1CVE2_NECAM
MGVRSPRLEKHALQCAPMLGMSRLANLFLTLYVTFVSIKPTLLCATRMEAGTVGQIPCSKRGNTNSEFFYLKHYNYEESILDIAVHDVTEEIRAEVRGKCN